MLNNVNSSNPMVPMHYSGLKSSCVAATVFELRLKEKSLMFINSSYICIAVNVKSGSFICSVIMMLKLDGKCLLGNANISALALCMDFKL